MQRRPCWEFEHHTAQSLLCRQFKVKDLTGFGIDPFAAGGLRRRMSFAIFAIYPALSFTSHFTNIQVENHSILFIMDAATRRNLELTHNLSGQRKFFNQHARSNRNGHGRPVY